MEMESMTEKKEGMETEEMEELKLKENPFENYLILRNIFKYVYCIEDLKNIRLANSLWLQESSQQWDNVQTMTIYKISSHVRKSCSCCQSKFILTQSTDKTYYLQEFFAKWELAEPHQGQCMQRFRLTNFCLMHPPAHVECGDFVRLFDLIGNQITYLHLDHCSFHPVNYMNGLTWILWKCVNLQTLIVILGGPCERFWVQPIIPQEQLETAPPNETLKRLSFMSCHARFSLPDTDFQYLLKISPNLNTLETNITLTDVTMNALMQQQPYPSTVVPWRLANLGLLFDYELAGYTECLIMNIQDNVPTLNDIRLHLRSIDNVNVLERRVPELLAICQNSLEKLDIKRTKLAQTMPPVLRCLGGGLQFACLTNLYVTGESYMSFATLKAVPNLKVLRLKSARRHDWNRILAAEGDGPEDILYDKLEAFYADYFWLLPKTLRLLKKWMPNVKKLGVAVTPGTLPLVKELWPDLDKLLLVKGSILVEGGIPISSDVAHVDNGIN